MLLTERMAFKTAVSHLQDSMKKVLEMSSNPWKCFINRKELRRLNGLMAADAGIIETVLLGVKYSDLSRPPIDALREEIHALDDMENFPGKGRLAVAMESDVRAAESMF